ncbi:hypothetical protein HII13_001038 [Brettanomyces bruxellensis]|nr:hypothetical protein HII13_001038 [Brettanomyces bruxellensis]
MPSILHGAPLNVAASSSTENIDKKEDESFINRKLDDFGKDSSHLLALSDSVKDEKVQALSKELGLNHKKLMWKIDLCVVPPFCLLYFLAFLDRVNISNAKIYHMESDLGLHGEQFNIALTAFFIPYVIFEVLSNYMLKIIKPHIWLGCMIFLLA